MYVPNVLVLHHTNSNARIITGSYIIYFKTLWLHPLIVNNSRYTSYLMVSYKLNVCKQKSQYCNMHYNTTWKSMTENWNKKCAQLSCIKLVYLNYQNSYYSIRCQILSVNRLRIFLFQNTFKCKQKNRQI
jgi:hypothetical protein